MRLLKNWEKKKTLILPFILLTYRIMFPEKIYLEH